MMATTLMSQGLRSFVWLRVAKPALMALALAATPAASAGNCDSPHWVSAWQAPPGDAITPADANAQRVLSAGRQAFRSIIAPTGHGAVVKYATAATNAARMRLNEWIRTQRPADAVVDFDAALRDPADTTRLAAEFDGGDGLACCCPRVKS